MYRRGSIIGGAVKKGARKKPPKILKGPPGSIILQAMSKNKKYR